MIITPLRISGNLDRPELIVDVPLQSSFHVPSGTYHAVVRHISTKPRYATTSRPMLKIVFGVDVPDTNIDYLAKIELKLDLSEGSDLCNVIGRLMGRKALLDASGSTFNLNALIGEMCDLEIEHIMDNAAEHEFPLVVVANIRNHGTLVKEIED